MVGILYVCTGRYNIFWKDFFISAEKFFLPSQEKTYFVFTDAEEIYAEKNHNVRKIYQKTLGWPYNTLMRFEIFLKAESELKKCDYLFFLNANMVVVDRVDEDIFPGKENNGLAAAIHPGFWTKVPDKFTYERNSKSTAYIPYGTGKYYLMGSFNGGETGAYLKMVNILKKNTQIDLDNHIIAKWWDESHLNHYLLDKNPLTLSPSYCFAEGYNLPFKPKVFMLNKANYGGVDFLRGLK